jgi:hypothetical protein
MDMFPNVLMFLPIPQYDNHFPYIVSLAKNTNAAFTLLSRPLMSSDYIDPVTGISAE